MQNTISTIEYKNHTISIYQDEYPQNPRENDNIGKFCIREHRRYNFPNELEYEWDSAEEDAGYLYDHYYIFELDCYEHGNIKFSLTGTGMLCNFDTSKNCGFIAIPKKYNGYDLEEWSISKTQDKGNLCEISEAEALKIAKGELEEYNDYLNGNVYGYIISGKHSEDSCWGYSGKSGYNYMIEEAKSCIDRGIEFDLKKHIKQVKAYIVNKVPLEKRKAFLV